MTIFQRIKNVWEKETLLSRVILNSGYLFSANSVSIAISAVQSILIIRMIGAFGVGIAGIVTKFASSISKLLSFRMGELVVKYVGQFYEQGKPKPAAAVLRTAATIEAFATIFSFVIVLVLAPFAATYFAKDPQFTPLFVFYGFSLLANLTVQTSTAILQIGNKFNILAAINLAQNIVTISIVGYAFLTGGGLWHVITAYLVGKVINGGALSVFSLIHARRLLGVGWWRVGWDSSVGTREFWQFAVSSNLSATVNLAARDSEELWMSFFLSPAAAGIYKTALQIVTMLMVPIDPFIHTTFPEISSRAGRRLWSDLKVSLRKITYISAIWTGAVSVFLAIFGWWLIPLIYTPEFAPVTPAALVLLVGYGTATIFYWNRPLVLSLGMPTYPLKVSAIAGMIKVGLSFLLVPKFGFLAQAGLMAAYLAATVILNVRRGLKYINQQQALAGGDA